MSETRADSGELPALSETRQATFERLMRPHLRRLYRLAYRLTGRASDAEDLLQDVLIRLFERTDELSGITDLRPWTSRVLYNRFVDQRRRSRTRGWFIVPWNRSADAQQETDADNIPGTMPGPEGE